MMPFPYTEETCYLAFPWEQCYNKDGKNPVNIVEACL